jgi:hypothetical protein
VRHRKLIGALAAGVLVAVAAAPSPAAAAAGKWSVVAVPNPDVQFSYLQGVDARTSSDAWAVGYVQPVGVGPFVPIALHWNGAAWATTTVPQQGKGTLLWGVSASRADDVWAVGEFFRPGYHGGSQATALHWDGTAWTPTTVPNAGILYTVANVAPGNAWAVGGGGVKHWDGTAWSDVVTPSPNASGVGTGSLLGISARAPDDIWAVGSYAVTRHISASFSLHYDGVSWKIASMPNATSTQLQAITAVGPNDAWAVGLVNGSTTQSVAEHWDGRAWTIVATPTFPAGAYLRSVSGRAGGDVWAAGLIFSGEANTVHTLTLHWNGTAWSTVASPPADSADLSWVSARPGNPQTWAVGSFALGTPLAIEQH